MAAAATASASFLVGSGRGSFSFIRRLILSLFLHLACFTIFSRTPNPNHHRHQHQPQRQSNPKSGHSRFSSISSYLKLHRFRLSSLRKSSPAAAVVTNQSHPPPPATTTVNDPDQPTSTSTMSTFHGIFPCSLCGELLATPQQLDLHHATHHSISDLRDGDSGKNVLHIIFGSGWRGARPPAVLRVLKIHNSSSTLSKFEDYRELVRSRAARGRRCSGSGSGSSGGDYERCAADGNERLRFYCSTVLCSLGRNGGGGPPVDGPCVSPYCNTCGIVRHGFAGKAAELEGIATHATGWGAHVSLPEEVEREFAFLGVRRAVLVCRVVAGRVARRGEEEEEEGTTKKLSFDSVISPVVRSAAEGEEEEEELVVFNPRAVLPCFVIIYNYTVAA